MRLVIALWLQRPAQFSGGVRLAVVATGFLLAACTSGLDLSLGVPYGASKPHSVNRTTYVARANRAYDVVGIASWYGGYFHGRRTASGQIYDQNGHTAAHRTLPFGTRVRVTNLENGRSLVLTVNDRGPFVGGRIIDVSRHAALTLGFWRKGTARVRIAVVGAARG